MFALVLAATLALHPAGLDLKRVESVADRFFAARPPNFFADWDPEVRAALLSEADQCGPLPEGSLDAVRAACWRSLKKHAWKPKGNEFDTPFGKASFLVKPKSGRNKGLVLGLHGGGEGAGDAGEATRWNAKDCMGLYPQGIRLVHDTWNTVHGERFMLTLIELAKVQYDVDPDRVYVMGFSMGGTGSWFLAGRHPDLLAGASPCAGVIMAEPQSQLATKEEVKGLQHGLLPNVRNVAMYSYIGLADRNCMPGTFLYAWDRIAELRAQDPGGYAEFEFKTYEGLAHAFPPGEPTNGIHWLETKKRNAFPEIVVWEYAADPFPQASAQDPLGRLEKHFDYWLRCAAPKDAMKVRAVRAGNTFDLTLKGVEAEAFSILLQPGMIDVEQDVVVTVNGAEVYRGRPQPDLRTVLESLDAKTDRTLVFDRRVDLGAR